MKIDTNDLKLQYSSHLLTDTVVPRPIAWVSTIDENGVYNLAPFSAFTMISYLPMIVGFSVVSYRGGQKKDTLRNIEFTKEFVINVVTEELAEAMNITAAPYPREVSEFEKARVTPIKADIVNAPMVVESPVKMECRVLQTIEFGEHPATSTFIIGSVLRLHVVDEYWNMMTKRIERLKLIGRLGGDGDVYCRTGDTFRMKRPTL